jgi:hypothetical protein
VGQSLDDPGARRAQVAVQEGEQGVSGGEPDRGHPGGVAIVFEGFTGLLDGVADAGGGDLQEVGEHVHGADLPLVEQREQQACGIVEEWLAAEVSGCPSGSAAALFAAALLGASGLGRGECGGQTFQFRAGHAGQPQVGQLVEHALAALGGATFTVGCRRGRVSDGLGMQGVVPGAVHGVTLDRQGGQTFLADRDARRVVAGVHGGLDTQTAAGAGRRNGLDDHLVAGQGPAPPVEGDVGEQPVFDLVPLQ